MLSVLYLLSCTLNTFLTISGWNFANVRQDKTDDTSENRILDNDFMASYPTKS